MIRASLARSFSGPRPAIRRILLAGVLPWIVLTSIVHFQAQVLAGMRGHPQPFWSALGYTAAIYSVWALLGPMLLVIASRLVSATISPSIRAAGLALGLPICLALHVGLFSLLYWPVYGHGFASRGEMIPYVLAANFGTGALAYATIVAIAFARSRRKNADPAPDDDAPPTPPPAELWVRAGGGRQRLELNAIEWISAAGDYVEVHMRGMTILADTSLLALEAALPPTDFARVHRTAIVRLDKVRAIRGMGRGDALLELSGGAAVRLSRRYRGALAGWAPLG